MADPQVYATADEMQKRFNEGRYYERLLAEEFHLDDIEDIGPAPNNFPRGTRSQIVSYLDRFDRTIVHAHQYGTRVGVSATGTQPDPKFIHENGVRYKYSPLAPLPPLSGG